MNRAPGSYAGLTVRQADLLSYLRTCEAKGQTPTFRDMQEALDLGSTSGVHRLILGLEERGYVERDYHRARSITCTETAVRLGRVATERLVEELTSRGFSFYGMSAEMAA